jgi:5-methylcytosine-specific restriction protein B
MIEDQLYGREGLLETFTWSSVLKDYGPGSATAAETSAESEALAIDDQAH